MLLPEILQFLFPNESPSVWEVRDDSDGNGAYISRWDSVEIQPTEQELTDAFNGLTSVGGQTYSEWFSEINSPTLNARKVAREDLDRQLRGRNLLHRATILVVMDEINILRATHSLAPRTKAQLRQAVIDKINSGTADN